MRKAMKFWTVCLVFLLTSLITAPEAKAQCSICTRTAQQLGEKPAKGLNAGILYLAFTPLVIIGFVAWKWKKKNTNS
jgi:hypothetical protein